MLLSSFHATFYHFGCGYKMYFKKMIDCEGDVHFTSKSNQTTKIQLKHFKPQQNLNYKFRRSFSRQRLTFTHAQTTTCQL